MIGLLRCLTCTQGGLDHFEMFVESGLKGSLSLTDIQLVSRVACRNIHVHNIAELELTTKRPAHREGLSLPD